MSVLSYLLSGKNLRSAKKYTAAARKETGENADQLYQLAYQAYALVSESYSNYPDALYQWGFALLHQAQSKPAVEAEKIFEESITKFSFCSTVAPNHLGAANDGGVAFLGQAKAKNVNLDHELYIKAKELFDKAETIQIGTASYNLACMYALQSDGDACLEALENARDHGLVPTKEEILNDDDLENVKLLPWFDGFIESLALLDEDDDEYEDEDEEEELATEDNSEEIRQDDNKDQVS